MADQKSSSTAEQLRGRRVIVTVPGDDVNEPMRILCRRPDPLVLFSSELLPLAVYGSVVAAASSSIGEFSTEAAKDPGKYGDFIDRWACAAAVNPLVVMTEAESSDVAIWVEDLAPEVRVAIFMRTNDRLANKRVIDAVAEFRRTQPMDPGSGPSGAAIRDVAVEALVTG